jgi:hypothetical protein
VAGSGRNAAAVASINLLRGGRSRLTPHLALGASSGTIILGAAGSSVILQERAAVGVGFVHGVCPDGTSRSSGPHFQQRSVRGPGLTTLINRTFPRPILAGMARQSPKPQAPTIWTIYKAAANLRPLGIVEPSDEDEAIEKAAKRVQGGRQQTHCGAASMSTENDTPKGRALRC